MVNICECCGCSHNGTYASGRFCSQKCARSYSTKAQRKEIDKKVSEALLSRRITHKFKTDFSNRYCIDCGVKLCYRNKNRILFYTYS